MLELLVAALIGSVALAALGGLFLTSQRVATGSESQSFLQRQGALMMDEMTQRIRPASALTLGSVHRASPTDGSGPPLPHGLR